MTDYKQARHDSVCHGFTDHFYVDGLCKFCLQTTPPVHRDTFDPTLVRELLEAAQPISTLAELDSGVTMADWALRVLTAAQRVRESEAQ